VRRVSIITQTEAAAVILVLDDLGLTVGRKALVHWIAGAIHLLVLVERLPPRNHNTSKTAAHLMEGIPRNVTDAVTSSSQSKRT
jgi:hypothetical protein